MVTAVVTIGVNAEVTAVVTETAAAETTAVVTTVNGSANHARS